MTRRVARSSRWRWRSRCRRCRRCAADFRVGIVDMQRALNESTPGKKAKDQFKGEFEKIAGRPEAREGQLDRLKEDLDKKGVVLKEEQRQDQDGGLRAPPPRLRAQARGLRRRAPQEGPGADRQHRRRTCAVVIQEIGEREGYTRDPRELEQRACSTASKSIDITDSVIKAFDAKH